MNNKLAKEYSRVLLRYGVNLQKDQPIFLTAPVEAYEFVHLFCEEAFRYGAGDIHVEWDSSTCFAQRLNFAREELLLQVPESTCLKYREAIERNAAIIRFTTCHSPIFQNISSDRMAEFQKSRSQALQFFHRATMNSELQWLVAAVATPVWAKMLFPDLAAEEALESLWDHIFSVARIQEEGSLENWQNHLDHLHHFRRCLNHLRITKLHYSASNGTDFTIGLPATHIWQGGNEKSGRVVPFAANIPTEEVFTAPHRLEMDGVVYSTRPLIAQNQLITGIRLEFAGGKVISADADEGKDVLQHVLATDEGSTSLGEVALVPKESPIAQFPFSFYSTLIDENASCHLALGAAYPTCIENGKQLNEDELKAAGLNRSDIHVDFMIGCDDLKIDAETEDGRTVPIFRNGTWSIEMRTLANDFLCSEKAE